LDKTLPQNACELCRFPSKIGKKYRRKTYEENVGEGG